MAESCGVAAVAVHGQHQGTVLFRKGRLGYYPPGKRGGKDTGDRKRGCIYTWDAKRLLVNRAVMVLW
mgnify:CR=1 FL=1